MADIAALSDRVMVMNEGKLVMMGTPREVFAQRDRLLSIGLGVPPVSELMHRIKAGGAGVKTDILDIKEAEEEIYNYLQRKQ
jgi:energy-coupling factor transport system ATP-binding protein